MLHSLDTQLSINPWYICVCVCVVQNKKMSLNIAGVGVREEVVLGISVAMLPFNIRTFY